MNAVADLLAGAGFELIPLKGVAEKAAGLPNGAAVSVTASPAKGMTATIDLAAALREQGFVVTPHLSARMIKNRSELSGIVSRLFREGIDRAFVVGGDADDPGQFKDALELLRELSDLGHHLNEVGVTGYPEGHPFISGDLLRQALIDKQRYATYIATQMCFDAPAIVTWVKGTRLDGVRLPINVGIPGVVDPIRLAGIAARIGVGTSVRYVTKNRKMIWRFLRPGAYRPTKLLRELGAIDPALGLRGLHIFTFNLIEPTVAWFQESVEAVRGR